MDLALPSQSTYSVFADMVESRLWLTNVADGVTDDSSNQIERLQAIHISYHSNIGDALLIELHSHASADSGVRDWRLIWRECNCVSSMLSNSVP